MLGGGLMEEGTLSEDVPISRNEEACNPNITLFAGRNPNCFERAVSVAPPSPF